MRKVELKRPQSGGSRERGLTSRRSPAVSGADTRLGRRCRYGTSIPQLGFGATAMESSNLRKSPPVSALFDRNIVVPAIGAALVKLDPHTLIKNPVMFVLEVVTA